jgi:hypothetical protein
MLVFLIMLVVLIISAVSALILFDVFTDEEYSALVTLRNWQTLVGAILGFVTGAGIIAISTTMQIESDQLREAEQLKRVGEALIIEAETLDSVLGRAEGLRGVIDGVAGACPSDVLELAHSFQRETPIYDMAIPHFVEVGAANLSLFVSFYGTYGELQRDIASWVSADCIATQPNIKGLFFDKLAAGRKTFAALAAQYPHRKPVTGTPAQDATNAPFSRDQ